MTWKGLVNPEEVKRHGLEIELRWAKEKNAELEGCREDLVRRNDALELLVKTQAKTIEHWRNLNRAWKAKAQHYRERAFTAERILDQGRGVTP